jgi:hypothetical protein
MNLKLTIPAAMAALMIASTSASAAELITNGDFANGTYAGWTLTGTAADGGTTKVISLDGGAFGEVVPNDPNVPNSNYGLYFYSDIPLGVGASQTFNVATAGTYKVSFDYYIPNNGIFNPEDADLSASVNSTNFANFDADVLGNDNRTWRTASTTETLQAGSNTFSFGLSVPANVANGRLCRFQRLGRGRAGACNLGHDAGRLRWSWRSPADGSSPAVGVDRRLISSPHLVYSGERQGLISG